MDEISSVRVTALLPAGSPLPMPVQPLRPFATSKPASDRMTGARLVLLLLSVSAAAAFAYFLYEVLSIVRVTVLQGVFLVLCTLCFGWIALGSSSALLGFARASGLMRRNSLSGAVSLPSQPTALLFPVYNEDTARIAATIEAMATELSAGGDEGQFDFFVLSDSRDPRAKTRELRAIRLLRKVLQNRIRIFYRARVENVGKKAGNIAEWVERFGGGYESFIILDADSVMSASAVLELRSRLSANPRVALIQTVPRLVGARTLFAQLQQFAVAIYGPVVSAGFAAWHQGSGNYWGHNAIIRTQAFATAAGLPSIPGRPPLGGHIQSHDFVEAAFLRRAGWEVWMLPELQGSYEGCPPTLIDTAVRDRRWAQGNLQHMRVIGAAGLPWVSRMHLAMGAYGYFASVFWALSLVVGVILAIQSVYTLPVYFSDERTLFPIWPVIDPVKALYVFLATILVVLLPKLLGLVAAFLRGDSAARRGWCLLGVVAETAFSILLAPIFMLTQTRAVAEVLMGKDSGWGAQQREGSLTGLREAFRFHRGHLFVGFVGTSICALVSPYVLAWMAPILLGLILSVALSVVTSRAPPVWLAHALATAESIRPPPICGAVELLHAKWTDLLKRNSHAPAPGPAAK
jgi:membrane glycosyltransferase